MKTKMNVLGDTPSIKEFRKAHCAMLGKWFDSGGDFVGDNFPPSTRERLWNCLSLLSTDNPAHWRLANTIIGKTPIDNNHFLPTASCEILLRHRQRLDQAAESHLLNICRRHFANMLDIRFGNGTANNFSCMATFYFVAASQLLDTYDWQVEFASEPITRNASRIEAIARNAVMALKGNIDGAPLFGEFNSPTYTPISLHYLACIAEFSNDLEIREMAESCELKLWEEVFNFFHPRIRMQCGPYSRAYRPDILGFIPIMRMLISALEIHPVEPLGDFLTPASPLKVLPDGNLPFRWAAYAWMFSGVYHVPSSSLTELERRCYPYRFEADIQWEPRGQFLPDKNTLVKNIQGKAIAGGKSKVFLLQHENCALAYVSRSRRYGHTFPFHFHYAVSPYEGLCSQRTVTGAVIFHGAPKEWSKDFHGEKIESVNFFHAGQVAITSNSSGLGFVGHALPEFSCLSADELSINTFIPVHFSAPEAVEVNGQKFTGGAIEIKTREASCHVRDGGFEYEITYVFKTQVQVLLTRWEHFLRFSGFWHKGEAVCFSANELAGMTVKGGFKIIARPASGSLQG